MCICVKNKHQTSLKRLSRINTLAYFEMNKFIRLASEERKKIKFIGCSASKPFKDQCYKTFLA